MVRGGRGGRGAREGARRPGYGLQWLFGNERGRDPAAALAEALGERSLAGARDVARVLAFRLPLPGAGAVRSAEPDLGQTEAAAVRWRGL